MLKRPKKDLVEVFGYAPDDLSPASRSLWKLGACPFIKGRCIKTNHDNSLVYGTCSVTSPYGDCVICPNRLYENNYACLKHVATDAFGPRIPFRTYDQYVENRNNPEEMVVALGQNSGKEVKIGTSFSMDWILAKVGKSKLIGYVGIEVQSIDITGNYRDAWHGYKNLTSETLSVPSSGHGMNWANVHKRLLPQLIRKGQIYSKSDLVETGLYFIVPEIVYLKFEDILGKDMPVADTRASTNITVHTYSLTPPVAHGNQRSLRLHRTLRFTLEDLSDRFTNGPNLPTGIELDDAVKNTLGLT